MQSLDVREAILPFETSLESGKLRGYLNEVVVDDGDMPECGHTLPGVSILYRMSEYERPRLKSRWYL